MAGLLLIAGCGPTDDLAPEPSPTLPAIATPTPPPGCRPDQGGRWRRELDQHLGSPPRRADPGPTERLERVSVDGVQATRWRVGEAEAVWIVGEQAVPRDLHVVYAEDGELSRALVVGGDAVLWLPGPPQRPRTNELLLVRARRPPRRYALLHGWAALDAARMGRFGPVPGGRVVVHAGGHPESAGHLAVFDSRVTGLADIPDRLRLGGGMLWSLAACKAVDDPTPARGPLPLAPPRPATGVMASPEPAPWSVPMAPRGVIEADPPPPAAWVVYGPAPAGFSAPHVLGGPGHAWDWGAEDSLAVGQEVVAVLGVRPEQVGFLGVGAEGVHAMRYALANGGVAVAVSAPVTLWTDAAAAPAWPEWTIGEGLGVGDDPWWLAHALGERAVLVDPRDALGEPWSGPPPPARVVDTLELALRALGAASGG